MSDLSVTLLVASAALVGIAHAASPDHWLPIGLLARAHRLAARETAQMSAAAGLGHVAISVALGFLIGAVPPLQRSVRLHEGASLGLLLVATGVGLSVLSHVGPRLPRFPRLRPGILNPGTPIPVRTATYARIAIPMGVAASPNIAILPVLLIAGAMGFWGVLAVLLAFALATVVAFLGFTLAAQLATERLPLGFLERHGDDTASAILVLLGAAAWLGL